MMDKLIKVCAFGSCIVAILAGVGLSSTEPDGATIVGRVNFRGSVPPPLVIPVDQDQEFCGPTINAQRVLAKAPIGGLQNAVVSVEVPNAQVSEAPSVTVTLANRKCEFFPRVSAAKPGDLLEIINDDPVMHNTHIRYQEKTFINVAQVPNGPVIRKKVKMKGLMSVKCDKHQFMEAYLMVFDLPYFAITDETGQFRISGVPPGRRKITVWHEKLGSLSQEVIIPASGEISLNLEYR